MRSVNKVIIIGNLTRDPEMRQTPNGQNVTTFGIATNREWMTKNSERKNSAEFHECVAWSHLAEICSKFLKKGNLVYVEGYLKTRSWDSPEGVKKFKTEIVVQDMIMLEKRKSDPNEEYLPRGNDESSTSTATTSENKKSIPETTEATTEEAVTEAPVETISETIQAPVTETPATETPAAETPVVEAPADTPAEVVTESPIEEENPIDKDLGL